MFGLVKGTSTVRNSAIVFIETANGLLIDSTASNGFFVMSDKIRDATTDLLFLELINAFLEEDMPDYFTLSLQV